MTQKKLFVLLTALLLMSISVEAGIFGSSPKKPARPKPAIVVQEDSKNLGVDLGTRLTYIVEPTTISEQPPADGEPGAGLSNIIATGPSAIYFNLKTDETVMIGKDALGQTGKEAIGNVLYQFS